MMKKSERRIVWETAISDRGRPLVMELHPGGLIVRLKGTRDRWPISYESLLWLAAKTAADEERAGRFKKRKGAALERGNAREHEVVEGVHDHGRG
jgi:hypothetical protein